MKNKAHKTSVRNYAQHLTVAACNPIQYDIVAECNLIHTICPWWRATLSKQYTRGGVPPNPHITIKKKTHTSSCNAYTYEMPEYRPQARQVHNTNPKETNSTIRYKTQAQLRSDK